MAHTNVNHLLSLIEYFGEDFFIYIHWDRKSPISEEDMENLSRSEKVVYISRKYNVNWGGHNLLKAELHLLEKALKDGYGDYYHFISGQDYPTVSLKEFQLFFDKNAGKEFLEFNKLPRKDWDKGTFHRIEYFMPFDFFNVRTRKGDKRVNKLIALQKKFNFKRKIPTYFKTLYGGSAWFSLSKQAVDYLNSYTKKHPSFLRRLDHTFAPDEIYVLSILLNSPFQANIINNNLRYIDWRVKHGSAPAILDQADYYKIVASGCLFARKIVLPISGQLIDNLDKRISI